MNQREVFNSIIAGLGCFFTYAFGGWDKCLMALAFFMAIDYATGVFSGYVQKKLSSDIGRKGILKKLTIIFVVIMAVVLDRLINNGTWVFRTLVCYFYIGNEAISIFENAAKMGIPVPKKLVNAMEQLKKEEE